MNDDVAGLVERLEKLDDEMGARVALLLAEEAASTIRALVAENERLLAFIADLVNMQSGANWTRAVVRSAAADFLRQCGVKPLTTADTTPVFGMRAAAEAKLREAVELLRSIITSARYESSAVYVVRIPDDTVHQARAFLATMEKPQEDSTSE